MKVGAVSYLNTRPLIYGFERGMMKDDLELVIDYPAKIAKMLLEGSIDIGLVPVVTIPQLNFSNVFSRYCIGCDGPVASVGLFSDVPISQVERVLLDFESRTSVELLLILLKEYWEVRPQLVDTSKGYTSEISGTTAGLVIGDRALKQRGINRYTFDLGETWKKLTGLPFVFASWISNKSLSDDFITAFEEATALGLSHVEEIVKDNPFSEYDLHKYYTENISYEMDDRKQDALKFFLQKVKKTSLSTL